MVLSGFGRSADAIGSMIKDRQRAHHFSLNRPVETFFYCVGFLSVVMSVIKSLFCWPPPPYFSSSFLPGAATVSRHQNCDTLIRSVTEAAHARYPHVIGT